MSWQQQIAKFRKAKWREIGFRLQKLLLQKCEYFGHALGKTKLESGLSPFAKQLFIHSTPKKQQCEDLLTWMRNDCPAEFYFCEKDRKAYRQKIVGHFPQFLEDAMEDAQQICRGYVQFFGSTFHYPQNIAWHADPVTGKLWPQKFYSKIQLSRQGMDVKYVWELNRHQFLVPLAKAYWLTGDEQYAHKCLQIIEDWINNNPYKIGVNWTSALEVAFRSISWIWAYRFVLHSQTLSPQFHCRWLQSLHQHGQFLYRHLSFYFSPYNHLIGEVSALYMLGMLFPAFSNSSKWAHRGWHVLCEQIQQQFYADGGTVEQATFYHQATLGFYLISLLLQCKNGASVPDHVRRRVEKSLEFTMGMMRPDGSLPMIGDVDDGRSVRIGRPKFHWDFSNLLAIGAVLFRRSDMKNMAGEFAEDALWLLGLEGYNDYRFLDAKIPSDKDRIFQQSGYCIMRSDWNADAHVLCLDYGQQAHGLFYDETPSAAHGHADCLSVDVAVYGYPVIIDPGMYCYDGDQQWRDYFRKTRAHNTVEINGRDQAQYLGGMDWCRTYSSKLVHWSSTDEFAYVCAQHNGYRNLTNSAELVHRRAILFLRPDYWLIRDELIGSGDCQIRSYFHLNSGVTLKQQNSEVIVAWAKEKQLLIRPLSKNLAVETIGGCNENADSGWVAYGYGCKIAAPYICLHQNACAPAVWYTLLYPFPSSSAQCKIDANRAGWILASNNFTDRIIVNKQVAFQEYGIDTDGEWIIMRYRKQQLQFVCLIAGTYVKIADQVNFSNANLCSVVIHPRIDNQ